MGKYIEFVPMDCSGRTEKYAVLNKKSGSAIAIIKRYSPWRQYCFFPNYNTVWNKICLADVKKFIVDLMMAHKTKLENERLEMEENSGEAIKD